MARMIRVSMAVTLALMLSGPLSWRPPVEAQGVAKYAIIVAVDGGTSRTALRQLFLDVGTKISGRDADSQEPNVFQRYVLFDTLPEIDALLTIGVNSDVPTSVQNELSRLPSVSTIRIFFNPPVSRDEMIRRLKQWARDNGAAKYWLLAPGDDLSGFLLDHFIDF